MTDIIALPPTLGQELTATTDVTLDEHYHLLRLSPDKTRRIIDKALVRTPSNRTWAEVRDIYLDFWNPGPIVFWGDADDGQVGNDISTAIAEGRYLPYPPADGTRPVPSVEPVNQWPDVWTFKAHAATSMNQLEAGMSYHSMGAASEADRLTTFQTLSALLSFGWSKYNEYAAIDSQELVVGGNYDGTLLWKRRQPEFQFIYDKLCGNCNVHTYARRFKKNADIPLFRRAYRQGIIYAPDMTTAPKWGLDLVGVAPGAAPYSDFYDELDEHYSSLEDHYDHVVGPAEHA